MIEGCSFHNRIEGFGGRACIVRTGSLCGDVSPSPAYVGYLLSVSIGARDINVSVK